MGFLVTARKWRPQKFIDVVGQEHITVTLKNAIKNNRIAHAYLFTGPRGVGKTTTARILAKTLNCLNPVDNEPCGNCEMCKSITNSQSLDIIEIDGASNRGIDEIRTLRDSVKYAPTKGKFKVYIIDEVHMLTKESFNAFLKTLEEPPAHTIFIFATTDVHKVPLTIISRCQRFDFRRIQLDTIKTLLNKIAKEEDIKIDDKTLTIIGKRADGALRDAESYFDQVISFCGNVIDFETVTKMLNLIDDEIYFTISDAVLSKNFKAVFEVTNTIYENGWDFIDFIQGLTEHFRNIMTVVLTEKTDLIETADVYRTKYLDYSDKFSEGDILRLLNFLNKTHQELRYAQNHKLKIEISLSHLIGLEKSSTISDILNNLDTGTLNQPQVKQQSDNHTAIGEKKESLPLKKVNENQQTSYTSSVKKAEKKSINNFSYNIQNTVPVDPSINFDIVVKKWENFVTAVNNEKGLMLGPFIQTATPVNLSGNTLHIASENSHGKDIIKHHEDYINKKTLEFFGKKLFFQFSEDLPSKMETKVNKKEEAKKTKTDENDPFIKMIINELGGEEIH